MTKNFAKKIHLILNNQKPVTTGFLTESEQDQLLNIDKRKEFTLEGGYQNATRKRALYRHYKETIACIKIDSEGLLTHQNILGSFLGAGYNKDDIGDILPSKDVFYVKKELAKELPFKLTKIGRFNVKLTEIDGRSITFKPTLTYENYIVSSMRLDVLVAALASVSRTKAQELIQNKLIKVNDLVRESNNYEVEINDYLSIRQVGRFLIKEHVKQTRKEKIVLNIGKYA